MPKRLLTIAHSYVVNVNRRLAHEMARVGRGEWEVVAAAPEFFHGGNDLRPQRLVIEPDEPCAVEPIPARWTRRVHVFTYGRRLRSLLREGWDLVHQWEEPYILAGGQIAWWTPRGVPLVFWTAQNLSKRYPPPFAWIENYCLDRCAGWMACGESVVQTMCSRGYGRRPHRVMPLGVDLELFKPDRAAGKGVWRELGWPPDGAPVVGYLGRLTKAKGLPLLMRAMDALATPWRLLLVGSGELEAELRAWAAGHGERVRLCTDVRHDAVPAYLNAMDLLVAPSRTTPTWREQFGRMSIEAFACGVPVIGSDSGEIPHVIAGAGRIVAEADVEAWTREIGELLESSAQRDDLRRRGLERARDFAWPVIARRHLAFFDELLEQRRSRS
jgi:glycosyltransferase involved in cell wall biosynthesis